MCVLRLSHEATRACSHVYTSQNSVGVYLHARCFAGFRDPVVSAPEAQMRFTAELTRHVQYRFDLPLQLDLITERGIVYLLFK